MKQETTLKRERASEKLIKEFNFTNIRIAEIFNVSKQLINEAKNKSKVEEYSEDSMYLASDKDISLIKMMVQDGNYTYNDNECKIELINDCKGNFVIIIQGIGEPKTFFYDDIKNDAKWKEIIYFIHKYRLDVLHPEEKTIIETGKKVYVTGIPFFRPNYELFHKYKKLRNLNEDDYVKFLGFTECRFIPKKYEYTDDKIKNRIKDELANNQLKLVDGKLYIPSVCWIRNRCSRQEEQLTGKHLSLDEFVKIYGYEQLHEQQYKEHKAENINKYKGQIKREVSKTVSIIDKFEKEGFIAGEREAIVKNRIGQGIFKKMLLEKYEGKCCICNLSNKELLIGSHIREWSKSNFKQRCDVNNGLLLCNKHDSLFDKHLISFDKQGHIIISKKLSLQDREILGITKDIIIDIDNEIEYYMEYHRKKLRYKEEN